jgi:hypothetical protein
MIAVLISMILSARSCLRSRAELQLELLALRHQLYVLNRSRPRRLRLVAADWWLWAWLSRAWPAWRTALVIVKPETVIANRRHNVADIPPESRRTDRGGGLLGRANRDVSPVVRVGDFGP